MVMDQENSHPNAASQTTPETARKLFDYSEVFSELTKQVKLAGPLVLVSLLQYSLLVISVMFIGHLGELAISSASLATSFAGVTGFTLMLGMGGALETLCGQAYGAKQYHMLGIYMQRAMLIFMLICIPIALLWIFTGELLRLVGQDLEISSQAGVYAKWLIPSIFPYGLLQCQLRFLQTQSRAKASMISTSITTLLHVFGCWILVLKLGLGSKGAALSSAISSWFNVLVLYIYIKISPSCKRTWTGLSKEGCKGLLSFLSLGIPSALMLCLEFWSYEVLVLMSGRLPNPKLETSMMSISLNTVALIYRVAFGFGSAVSTRVSNELGAGRPDAAMLAAKVILFLAVVEGLVLNLTFSATRRVWGYLYSNEKEVVKYLASIIPILAISNFMDGIQGVLSGVARGCGWQKTGAVVNFGAYYLVGLPCAIVLTFVLHFGGKGFWLGIIAGSSLQALVLLVVMLRTDWEMQAKKAKDRVYASTMPTN